MPPAPATVNNKIFCCAVTLCLALWFVPCDTRAALPLDPPSHFFTNVAGHLLQQQLGMRLRDIQIAPTNQYDSAVHRIFQVTANIYDATTTNVWPTVFRPLFDARSNGVFLAGFTNDHRVSTLAGWLEQNTNGIPLVIGAKKGLPNFNEFTLRSDILVQRRMQLTRPNTVPGTQPSGTNQMYVLSISNYFGVEAWNSYDFSESGPYPRPVKLSVSNLVTLVLSNDAGIQTNALTAFAAVTNIATDTWRGGETSGFILPLNTNGVFVRNAVYRFNENAFENGNTNAFEATPTGFPLPYWIYSISNRLTYLMSEPDGDDERIIDFVLLQGSQDVDLFGDLVGGMNPYQGNTGFSAAVGNLWNTNRVSPFGPTVGILQQMDIALGNVPTANSEWRTFGLTATPTENDKAKAIDAFRVFCGFGPLTTNQVSTNLGTAIVSPFNPAAKLSVLSTWQANDPLVHYQIADLALSGLARNHQYLQPNQSATNIPPSSLGRLNDRYAPWGGRPGSSYEGPTDYNLSLKDPGVMSSDNWNFPSGAALSADWLGRVHRGTPWQTIYLKSEAASLGGSGGWTNHSADLVVVGDILISRTHPTNDWRMVAWFAQMLQTNDLRTLTSVNATNAADWKAVFSGFTVLSNNLTTVILWQPPRFETNVIAPDAPQLETILTGIQRLRSSSRGQYFADVGAFLSVPELSTASPWLNLTGDQVKWGLTDEAYEILPGQLLSLIRADPVGTAASDGQSIQMHFSAWPGYSYRVESSTNGFTWESVSSPHTAVDGGFKLTLPVSLGHKFFRAVLLP